MQKYQRPEVKRLGEIRELTKGTNWDWAYDGTLFHSDPRTGS